jgi:alkyldihydroxyacetonephosphate synthase
MSAKEMSWSGWGDPAKAAPLSDSVVGLLEQLLGVRRREAAPIALGDVRLPDSALSEAAQKSLTAAVGDEHVRTDAEARIRHTRGKSTPDLLRIRTGQADDAPDAIVLPASHDEVVAVLSACGDHRLAVVPFGGGTSVVGGLEPTRGGFGGVIALDLRRMDRLLAVDPVSRTATLQPGLRGPQAESLLAEHGFELGHLPQSFEYATVGGFAAARSSGQASAGYGRFDEMVVGLTVATPVGTLELGRAPMSAAGPDLRQLVLGSEGAFGVITSVTVRVHPVPEQKVYEGWRFGSFAGALTALRRLAQDGPLPTVLRLSDETETLVGLAKPESVGADLSSSAGCLVVTGYEGAAAEVTARREAATAVLRECGAQSLGPEPGEGWLHGRYSGPYLRDALLDVGALAETLETATFWSNLPELYDAVRAALTAALTDQGTPPLVLCHISHVYAAGASLYFTVVSAQADDPLAQWRRAKAAANDAIVATGGTISHHHAVGADHRDWFAREIGPVGVEILRAVKARLDPDGILNPGILVP